MHKATPNRTLKTCWALYEPPCLVRKESRKACAVCPAYCVFTLLSTAAGLLVTNKPPL